ncbi:hypothetical protein Goari_022749 [Gossypium aridum]|uniref:Agenet domain-containing protein n=1 Tax=Gossypium aridum TaxID=34290 RepID=A0A7J8YST9_GOSAI|nr:hypothetical protein [Gossypium aridum]
MRCAVLHELKSLHTCNRVPQLRSVTARQGSEVLDEAGAKALRETFHAFDIGPPAPRETTRKFKFGEEVDAFHNDGWWEGEITKELENGNFHVYFKRSKEQLEFREDKLRLHREWLNGSWVPPLEEAEQVQEVNSIVSLDFF